MNVLVIAPHPDDEVFGVGGTIARLASEGSEIFVAIVTTWDEKVFSKERIFYRRNEIVQANQLLGAKVTIFLDKCPGGMIENLSHTDLNKTFVELFNNLKPDILFIPFKGDMHFDHRLVFESCLVASRPNRQIIPRSILSYETLSETNWNAPFLSPSFSPNIFVDISEFLETKIKAVQFHQSQLKPFPNERSIEALRALAVHRGATVGFRAAESFVLVRSIYSIDNHFVFK